MSSRRDNVSFDPRYFEKQEAEGRTWDLPDTFRKIYERNHWAGNESVSGEGSAPDQTDTIRRELPKLLKELEVNTLLDLPCGDLGWISHVELPVETYIGADIVPELIRQNRERFGGSAAKRFELLDITADPLPDADLILCRDCLVHFSFEDISRTFRNLKRSSIHWLLTTTFPDCDLNEDIRTGDWRLINLERPPFNLPEPERLINENCSEGGGTYRDKSLGLWRIADLS